MLKVLFPDNTNKMFVKVDKQPNMYMGFKDKPVYMFKITEEDYEAVKKEGEEYCYDELSTYKPKIEYEECNRLLKSKKPIFQKVDESLRDCISYLHFVETHTKKKFGKIKLNDKIYFKVTHKKDQNTHVLLQDSFSKDAIKYASITFNAKAEIFHFGIFYPLQNSSIVLPSNVDYSTLRIAWYLNVLRR